MHRSLADPSLDSITYSIYDVLLLPVHPAYFPSYGMYNYVCTYIHPCTYLLRTYRPSTKPLCTSMPSPRATWTLRRMTCLPDPLRAPSPSQVADPVGAGLRRGGPAASFVIFRPSCVVQLPVGLRARPLNQLASHPFALLLFLFPPSLPSSALVSSSFSFTVLTYQAVHAWSPSPSLVAVEHLSTGP